MVDLAAQRRDSAGSALGIGTDRLVSQVPSARTQHHDGGRALGRLRHHQTAMANNLLTRWEWLVDYRLLQTFTEAVARCGETAVSVAVDMALVNPVRQRKTSR